MRIAVIGSGISGLSASYYLSKKHKVDLFEKENHFGGHSHTIEIKHEDKSEKKISVDIGFIVFNYLTYPNLINFFKENNIDIEKSNMSFSVSVKGSNIEYCGKGLNGIFSNKKNLFNPKFIRMFFDILNFYKKSSKLIKNDDNISLGEYLSKQKLSKYFIDYHILPMVAAIWSLPPEEASKIPFNFFLKFFQNHGLFNIKNRPQWYTVSNRSRTYVEKILKKISGEHYKNYSINKIKRTTNGVQIYYGEKNEFFDYDKVVIATHADEALSLIDNPLENERKILKNFKYKKNLAIVHFDENFMPKNKKVWSSWNSSIDYNNLEKNSITYWLNLLQNLKISKNIFLTLNPFFQISEDKIFQKIYFTHPYYNNDTLINQKKLHELQNKKNILFCGSYFGYGFHEDGIKSTIKMIKCLDDN
tara:strand:+ start:500 stop:1750 length:1251 start_codon:yes stop_codon:yes gene_type:complete